MSDQQAYEPRKNVVVAIDGLAASGKGTVARLCAQRFGYAHLDTGLLYRAVAAKVVDRGADPADPATQDLAIAAAGGLTLMDLQRADLRDARTGAAASYVAAYGAVRAKLLDYQREFALKPPGGARGAVLDGRDIGTVVCPDADVKLFVVARPEVRAHRRCLELRGRGFEADPKQVEADLVARDERDRTRAESPMTQAADAILLDTSDLSIDASIDEASSIILRHIGADNTTA
ncbi:MAG: (d)CMP kinase [Neomegalonema sp.]|nr:(d)CMP kinase [Neomegalonema sp.]